MMWKLEACTARTMCKKSFSYILDFIELIIQIIFFQTCLNLLLGKKREKTSTTSFSVRLFDYKQLNKLIFWHKDGTVDNKWRSRYYKSRSQGIMIRPEGNFRTNSIHANPSSSCRNISPKTTTDNLIVVQLERSLGCQVLPWGIWMGEQQWSRFSEFSHYKRKLEALEYE